MMWLNVHPKIPTNHIKCQAILSMFVLNRILLEVIAILISFPGVVHRPNVLCACLSCSFLECQHPASTASALKPTHCKRNSFLQAVAIVTSVSGKAGSVNVPIGTSLI